MRCDFCDEDRPIWKMERFAKGWIMLDEVRVCLGCARDLVKRERGWTSATSHVRQDSKLVIASKPCEVCGYVHYPRCRGARRLEELG